MIILARGHTYVLRGYFRKNACLVNFWSAICKERGRQILTVQGFERAFQRIFFTLLRSVLFEGRFSNVLKY